ncbi:MAG: 7-cyano-7-deazaguanine synthase, partial [Deltaproteobacteria bacterium]|nr:7-cyano-7-deazaguanine synthase [Deltaproteobacteria bacterium]
MTTEAANSKSDDKKAKTRVLVAMSGGVDSSVAAYLLQKQGYDVVGVTFQLYDYSRQNRKEGKGGCCSVEDVDDAKYVCAKLGIPHYLFDSRKAFKDRVVTYFAESYK